MQLGLRHREHGREARGGAHGVADDAGLREERFCRRGGRERRAPAVDDRAAERGQRDRARVLALRERRELGMPDELQVAEPRHHASERDGEHRRQDQHPRPERGRDHAGATRAAREVLARQTYLLAARHDHAELPRAGLDATGRAERGNLDLELPQQHLGPDPLAAKGVELVGEVHLLHAKTDHHEEPHHEDGGAEQGHGERAPQARIWITMETLMSLH